ERAGDRVVNRSVGVVLNIKSEQSGGQRRIPFIMRDERAEGRHTDLSRKGFAMERDLGDGEAADEGRVVEVRRSCHRVAIGAEAEPVELSPAWRARRQALVRPVQHARVDELAVPLRLDREMTVTVMLMDRRPIADAPIYEPAAARERNASRSDPAEGKGDVLAARASIDESGIDPRVDFIGSIGVHGISQFLMPLMAMPSITIF